MALTFTETPLRWQSAQLPVIYEFNYEIVLPALDPMNPAYIGSYVSDSEEGYLRILVPPTEPNLLVGSSFYVAYGTELLYPLPVQILESKQVVFGGGDVYTAYLTDTVYTGGTSIDVYELDFVEQFNPTFRLYVNDVDTGAIRYDRKADGVFRINLSPYLRREFREIGFPGLVVGTEDSLFRKYRLDYTINGVTTTGEDKYCLNSMLQPGNPSCSNNLPNWQFDLTTLQCEQTVPRTSSNRVAKMKDVNPGSATYNTYRDSGAFFYYDSNATACPVVFSNVVRSQQFRRNNCTSGNIGSFVTYTVPAGTYTSTVSQADANAQADADIAANGQAYANANGTCSLIAATFEYRDALVTGDSDDNYTQGDVYLVFAAGGPITFYYDVRETNTYDSSSVVDSMNSVALSGTEVLVASGVIFHQYQSNYLGTGDPNTYQKYYENIRLTP